MQLLTLTTALLASTATAKSLWGSSPNISPNTDGSLSVPGENPLQHCEDPKNDILTLKSVDLTPNPPKAGQTLQITAKGTLSEDVDKGSEVHLTVKYGLITIIRQTADLCDTITKVDLSCPLKKDEQTELTKSVELPKEIPPGKYSVIADVYNADKKKVTCLTATVEFHRKKDGEEGVSVGQVVLDEPKQGL
ncbi:hypothetical protein KC340_g9315 [Hortaea werneckii]|nr:hypothetical protein KC342_g12196 [Hortaea werneckii]KAI7081244.1 hypothetical protein KC339_g13367 [Hortaea werneckii]KAI7225576.1 hypothetical protein KC365_g9896 [Hortaea werneckii]KAI7314555.1 hypothetical protein KC340_g9315 [Hortaea werneckii]KAI7371789.1 hypothetical protein KC328_g17464 [Hortaea werneckii]